MSNKNNPNKPSSNDTIPPPSHLTNLTITSSSSNNNNGNNTIIPSPPLLMEEPHPHPQLSTTTGTTDGNVSTSTDTPHYTAPSIFGTDPQQSMMLPYHHHHHQVVLQSLFSDNVPINTPPATTTEFLLASDRATHINALWDSNRLMHHHHHHQYHQDFAHCFDPPPLPRCRSLPQILDDALELLDATIADLSGGTIHTDLVDDDEDEMPPGTNRYAWNAHDHFILTVHPSSPPSSSQIEPYRRSGPRQRSRSHMSTSRIRRNRRNQRGDNNNNTNNNHDSSSQ